eukprot:CAMPEP_0198322146 /NCGR_PEP_ID=MMETSP1450-20131203/10696_1 /TAXON_ID=753684 ORGANISM="Madagascaria erythrocladiodes, Strain CCMP3234" /NCGR_SAMPLE_ID=MMETSP1450 /ASSEMBLY_ACC=CAM_ASM_001115 /LENGTH=99 /DNA_ID=CAMNT_0044025749 /DNA_START=10 /DNA_END=305 /DNA_ORIENTATION=+
MTIPMYTTLITKTKVGPTFNPDASSEYIRIENMPAVPSVATERPWDRPDAVVARLLPAVPVGGAAPDARDPRLTSVDACEDDMSPLPLGTRHNNPKPLP